MADLDKVVAGVKDAFARANAELSQQRAEVTKLRTQLTECTTLKTQCGTPVDTLKGAINRIADHVGSSVIIP